MRSKSEKTSGLWFYGTHAVLAALANRRRGCLRLLATEETLAREGHKLSAAAAKRRLPLSPEPTSRQEIAQLLPAGAVHQGLALLVEPLVQPDLQDLLHLPPPAGKRAVIIALDQVSDPHNVGAILRSAAAFEALGVITPTHHTPGESGALAKSATGALEVLPYVPVGNLSAALTQAKKADYWCLGLDSAAPKLLRELDLPEKIILIMGAEGSGLRRLTEEHCDFLAQLPTTGVIKDLNVSNATAISLYELLS